MGESIIRFYYLILDCFIGRCYIKNSVSVVEVAFIDNLHQIVVWIPHASSVGFFNTSAAKRADVQIKKNNVALVRRTTSFR